MQVEKIWINRFSNGALSGKIEIKGKVGTIEVRVSDEKARQIINILADQIVDLAKETADIMRNDVIEHVKQSALLAEKTGD